jgi:hypothetical protein
MSSNIDRVFDNDEALYTEEPEEEGAPHSQATAAPSHSGGAAEASGAQAEADDPAARLRQFEQRGIPGVPDYAADEADQPPGYQVFASRQERPSDIDLAQRGLSQSIATDPQTQRLIRARSQQELRQRQSQGASSSGQGSSGGRRATGTTSRTGSGEVGQSRQSSADALSRVRGTTGTTSRSGSGEVGQSRQSSADALSRVRGTTGTTSRSGSGEVGQSRQSSRGTTALPDYRVTPPRGHRPGKTSASSSATDLPQRGLRSQSQANLGGPQRSRPPVPPIPREFRSTPAAGPSTQTPGAGPSTQTPGAGPSTQTPGAGPSIQRLSRFAHPFNQQARTESKLRASVTEGNVGLVRHYLDKGGNPAEVSGSNKQNGFHKLAAQPNANPATTSQMMNLMLDRVPEASRAGAVSLQDRNGDTPIHMAQYQRGIAERRATEVGVNTAEGQRYQQTAAVLNDLTTRMTAMAEPAGRHQLTNREGRTPEQMYRIGLSRSRTEALELDRTIGRSALR